MPAVKRITPGTLTVSVAAGSATLYRDQAPVTVYPPSAGQRTTRAPLAAAVLETGGSTATSDALAALGVTTRSITDLSSLPSGREVLVLGEGATVSASSDQVAALTSFVQGGGRLLSFAQQTLPELLPWPVLLSGSQQTIAHVAAPHHPVLAGIGPGDLRWWNTGSEQVTANALVKPRYGALTSLADVGPGLASSALAEAPYGSGTYLFCQFPVISAAAREPVAAVLLRNLVDYLAARPSAARGAGSAWSPRAAPRWPARSPRPRSTSPPSPDLAPSTLVRPGRAADRRLAGQRPGAGRGVGRGVRRRRLDHRRRHAVGQRADHGFARHAERRAARRRHAVRPRLRPPARRGDHREVGGRSTA